MPFTIREHQTFSEEDAEKIKYLNLDFTNEDNVVKYVGLNSAYQTSYFIGLDWLKLNSDTIHVLPKIENLDFVEMFLECFKSPEISKYLDNIYNIDFNKPAIQTDLKIIDITPFLIIHFLSVMRSLVNKGIKRDYSIIEENLNSKIKGKLQFGKHLKQNIYKNRYDRNYCKYQEYSTDCLENRILKKTLVFAGNYIKKHLPHKKELQTTFNYCFSLFNSVKDDFDISEIKKIRINPVFKEYFEAIKLSKMILRKFGYSLSETEKSELYKTPPYWIDMSLLFECFVLGKLKDRFGSSIKYQEKGKYGNTDFLDIKNKIVIDTKYKLLYSSEKYDIDNIRQLSAYARDIKIRSKIDAPKNDLIDCCIIYPDENKQSDFSERNLLEEKIEQFEKFWKIGISLPLTSLAEQN